MDPLLSVTLGDFEISVPPDIFHKNRSTLLVGNIEDHDEFRVLGYLISSPFGQLDNLDNLGFDEFQITEQKILVECDLEMKQILIASPKVLLFDFTITAGYDPVPEKACQFRKGDNGIFIPWDYTIAKQHWVLDLFSGGYGGWKFGLDIVQQHLSQYADDLTFPQHCAIGIDSDLPSVTQSCINHQAVLLPDQPIPNKYFVQNTHDAIFHAPIQSNNWKQSVALVRPEWWTMSFPCQPWTSSANSLGFSDANGRSFAYAIGLLRIFRPRLCLLENVKGFAEHPQYPLAVKLFQWAGYQVLHQGVFEAAVHLPIKRPRYLAILARLEDHQRPFQWKFWGEGFPTNPKAWDSFFPTTPNEAVPFTPSPDSKRLYLDPSLLPLGAPESAKSSMLAYRIPDPTKKLPTMMAAYGEHHMLPQWLLKQKGLHGFFTSEHGSFRWFQPMEMALMHLQTKPLALLKPAKLAWHSVGNSIVTVHSILAIANLFAYHFQDFEEGHIATMIEQAIKARLRYRTVVMHQDEFAWYVGNDDQIDDMTKRVHFLAQQMHWDGKQTPTWPIGQYFHPRFGRIEFGELCNDPSQLQIIAEFVISPTIPYAVAGMDEPEPTMIESDDVDLPMIHEDGYMSSASNPTSDNEMSQQEMFHLMQQSFAEKEKEEMSQPIHEEHNGAPNVEDAKATANPRIMIAAIPGTYGELEVQAHCTWNQLLPLWDCKFLPTTEDRMQSPNVVISSILVTDNGYIGDCEMPPHFFIDQSKKTSLFTFDDTCTWGQIVVDNQLPEQTWFDDIGPIYSTTKLTWTSRIITEPLEIQAFDDLAQCIQAFHEVNLQCRIPTGTDVLVIYFEGQSEHLVQIASFWHTALSDEWCSMHGRKRCFQALTQNSCQFLFPPHGNKWASPALDLKTFIVSRLMRVGIYSMSNFADPEATPIEFKYHGRVHNPTYLSGTTSFEIFIALFQHATWILNFGNTPGLVIAGKRVADKMLIHDICQTHQTTRCHVIDPMVGGGPSNGSKGQHKQAVNAALAAMLIEEGLPLSKVTEAIKSLIDQMGLPSITHMLFSEPSTTRDHSFRLMCTNCDIQLPQKPSKIAKTQAKFQKIARDEAIRNNRNIDVSKYRLLPEYFRLMDGSPAPIQTTFSPCVSGVTMVNAQQASQWILQKGKLSPDELALFIVGDIGLIEDERLEKFTVPAYNEQGDKVLIGGWLLQLGEKHVTTISNEETMVQTLDVKICSVTMWSSDFNPEQWKAAVEQPVKFAKRMLEHDQLHQAIKSPWGRSLRAGKHPANQQNATSVQFHCEIRIKDLRPLLRRSGFNRIFVLPKDQDGKPDAAWRIIWTDMDTSKLETIATPIAGTAGLVKGHQSFGLRVEHAAFQNMWEILHPGRDPPVQVPKGSLWKANPMPIGLDKEIIQEWAKNQSWDCFPLKSLGSKTWLIQAPEPPPKDLMCFNGTPIIIRKVPPRSNQPQTGIIAGPRSQNVDERPDNSVFRKGDPFLDSWANWKPTASQTSSATSNVATKTDASVGPTTSRLDLQDKKIQELQQAVEQIHIDAKHKGNEDDRRFSTMESQIKHNHEQVQGSFQALRTDFESTLQRAMSAQDQKISSTMDEIKALFFRGSKRSQMDTVSPDDDDAM